ncbi:MAG: outer membrane protein assembly factor BamE [Planctomycetota bacterium]
MNLRLLLLASPLLLSGCFLSRIDHNRPLDPAVVAELRAGEHTADDVLARMGAPIEVVQLGHKSAWRYEYERTKQTGLFALVVGLHGIDMRADRVWVFFDENDRLTHVGATFESKEAEFELPFLGEDDSAGE